MSQNSIRLDDVSHLYDRTLILRHVSAELLPGRCYLLLGPNGAGKSTLLRILAGLLRPSFGAVHLWGAAAEQSRHRVGYMSHAPMLFDGFSATENLRFFGQLYGNAPQLTPEAALQAVGLEPSLNRPVSAYSQGMRQRVSLARVLLTEPDLLLLDEPFSNMDAESAEALLERLRAERDRGRTVVMTTHQRALALPVADELLLLSGGALRTEVPA